MNALSNITIKHKKLAFTLAEILIVLGIIGIIAEITIPVLLANVEDQKYRSSFKKTYSMLSQAYINYKQDGATSIDQLYNYLKVDKTCDTADTTDCWGANYRCADGSSTTMDFKSGPTTFPTLSLTRLTDGVSIKILNAGASISSSFRCGATSYTFSLSTNTPGYIYVLDLNGAKMPNKVGSDVFAVLSNDGTFKPLGTGCDASGIGCGYNVLMNIDY